MKNNKKQDKLTVNTITSPNEIKHGSQVKGNADQEAFCVYANERHAVGSKIVDIDGRETVCTPKGWQQNPDKNVE